MTIGENNKIGTRKSKKGNWTQIDYILSTGPVENCSRLGGTNNYKSGSDHYPISCFTTIDNCK
jgi:hypothetical protein